MKKNKKKFKRLVKPTSSSSSVSPEKPNGAQNTGKLYQYDKQSCEFCDSVFFNKYDHLTHNAHHIIIPLINQTVYQCTVCLFHFTSPEELTLHSAVKHGITSTCSDNKTTSKKSRKETKEKRATEIETENALEKKSHITEKNNVPNILESMINSESVVRCHDTVNKLLETVHNNIKGSTKNVANNIMDGRVSEKEKLKRDGKKKEKEMVNKNSAPVPVINGDVIIIDDDDDDDIGPSNDKNLGNGHNDSGIKSKIVFEDEPDSDDVNSDNETDHVDILKLAATTLTGNLIGQSKRFDMEVLNLNGGNVNGEESEDYILPDDGYLVNRILVPDNSYILPDNGPELIVPDLIPPCSNVPVPNEPVFNSVILNGSLVQDLNQPFFGKFLLGSKVTKDNQVSSLVTYKPSIHYKDLMSPGLYGCKRCRRKFPSRFQLISHEKTHLKIRYHIQSSQDCPLCDRYIAGNHYTLKRHIKEKHPNKPERSYNLTLCRSCGLRYRRWERHIRNYHKIYVCSSCGSRFETEIERKTHLEECATVTKVVQMANNDSNVSVANIKVCEICFMFMKNKETLKYVECGEWSEVGKRGKCESCQKEFFALKLVKRIHKWTRKEELGKKNSRNETRLKNMQTRLKKCNKLWQC